MSKYQCDICGQMKDIKTVKTLRNSNGMEADVCEQCEICPPSKQDMRDYINGKDI